MSTFNILSTVIANRDATPKVLTDAYVAGGNVCNAEGYVQTGAADGAGSIYRMFSIPSNARVETIKLAADALATGCTLDVGVYYPTYIPVGAGLSASLASTVINTQFFASAVAASNATATTDITNQSTNNTIVKQELPLWSAIGLTSDPGIDLDVCVTVHAAVAAQGYIGLKGSYVK
ncbi:MAG: hypothetical protein ABI351_02385 [Herbaspirillum sp.]